MVSSKISAGCVAAALLLCDAQAFTFPKGTPNPSFAPNYTDRVRLGMSSENDPAPFFASEEKEKEESNTTSNVATMDETSPSAASSNSERSEVLDAANDALVAVGWSSPLEDAEMTSEDPFVKRIDDQIKADVGVGLDELLNPAKVVNLERDLFNLRSELAYLTGKGSIDVTDLSTDECDAGGGGEEADAVRKSIEKKETSLQIERRAVFRGWLKNVFLGQAVLSLGLSWIMVSSPATLFGGFDWFSTNNLDVSIRVLGFWWWWLFIIPSLRSRRPSGPEKKALDIAFLGTPLISLVAPVATKETEIIWFANLAVTAAAYGYAFFIDSDDDDNKTSGDDGRPAWLKFVFKSLDFGVGRERGARS